MNSLNEKIIKMSSVTKNVMATTSISIMVGMFANFLYQYTSVVNENEKIKNLTEVITHNPFFPQFLSMTKDIGEFTISYDTQITIKGTGSLKIIFVPPLYSGLNKDELKPFKVTLSGTDIDFAPDKTHTFTPNEIGDKAEWEWSFRPKSTGPNKLVLTFENLPYEKWYQPMINSKAGYELSNPMLLDIHVNELSGLSPQRDYYVKAGGSILAFILMYPILITFFNRRMGLGNA